MTEESSQSTAIQPLCGSGWIACVNLWNPDSAQLAESTVKSRFNRLYKRFGVGSRIELLTTAMRKGILHSQK